MNKYNASQSAVELETNSVEELYWLAEQLPDPEQDQIQQLATSYARTVADDEWPLMEQGQSSPRAEALANELRRSVQGFEPGTSAEQALYSQGLERVHEFTENRGGRLLNARVGLPPVLWFVLVSLGIDTLLFTYFVGMKSARLHVAAVAALAAGITLILFTIALLDSPFGTNFRVSP